MRRQRQDRVRVCEIKPDAFRSKAVQRRGGGLAAVAAQSVGAQRVDRDQEDVLAIDAAEVSDSGAGSKERASNDDTCGERQPGGENTPRSSLRPIALSARRCAMHP